MLKEDRLLTSSNKKLIEKIKKIHSHLKNIVENSKQHCDFCKIMNVTQNKWVEKKFESSIEEEFINGESVSFETMPDYLIGNSYLLCDGC